MHESLKKFMTRPTSSSWFAKADLNRTAEKNKRALVGSMLSFQWLVVVKEIVFKLSYHYQENMLLACSFYQHLKLDGWKAKELLHSKQYNSSKMRATTVKDGLEKAIPDIKVLLNPEKEFHGLVLGGAHVVL